MNDIDIALAAAIKPIGEIADKLGIPSDALMPYGHTKAKVDLKYIETLNASQRQTDSRNSHHPDTGW